MSDVAIRVEDLSKTYRIELGRARYETLREALVHGAMKPVSFVRRRFAGGDGKVSDEHLVAALRGVSFELPQGQVLGLIGHNGAGKTTLLKILSRITEPSGGHAEIRGRVGSLLEVGTGFHPELTGRENVFLNGAILGMTKREIERKFDDIVAFADVERFVDTPVKRYSTGMHMRLAFAVAAFLEPEILLVDEVLAVGDAAFQRRCLGKMGEVRNEGRTVVLVSHNLAAIEALADRAIWLGSGRVVEDSDPHSCVTRYLSAQRGDGHTAALGDGVLSSVRIFDPEHPGSSAIRTGSAVCIEATITLRSALAYPRLRYELHSSRGVFVATLDTWLQLPMEEYPERLEAGIHRIATTIPMLNLVPDRYHVGVRVMAHRDVVEEIQDAFVLEVEEGDFFGTGRPPRTHHGVAALEAHWDLESTP